MYPVPAARVAPQPLAGRRYDLDWIRVFAFMALILYHVGMFYVPWDWHVKSSHQVEAIEPIMMLTHPWRLTLLFLVSGCATRFMADSFAAKGGSGLAMAGSRTLRLLPPLLFGIFVIVPPQTYYQVFEALRSTGMIDPAADPSLKDFYLRYVTASGDWCTASGCIVTPTWNHLWFVLYLLIYSLLLGLMLSVPGVGRGLQHLADRMFAGWGLVVWPLAFLLLVRHTLAPLFPDTHAFYNDWANPALSFGAFLFGFLTARSEVVRQGFIRMRWQALTAALASWAVYAAYAWAFRAEDAVPPEALRIAMRFVFALDQGAFIAAILGFGARWLNCGGPVLRYLTVGVFPFYVAHQTVTVVVGHHLARLGLPVGVEAPLLIAATAAGCLATYEIARRIGWFGLLLGVRPGALWAGNRARIRPRTARPWPHRPGSPG